MNYTIYVDGAARRQGQEDPGEASCAMILCKNGKTVGQMARGLGKRTNNEAEYEAVLLGLLMAWAGDCTDPIIYSDSVLVVKQVNNIWYCKTPVLVPLLMTIQDIRDVFRFRLEYTPRKTPGIRAADALAHEFLDALETRMEEDHDDGQSKENGTGPAHSKNGAGAALPNSRRKGRRTKAPDRH